MGGDAALWWLYSPPRRPQVLSEVAGEYLDLLPTATGGKKVVAKVGGGHAVQLSFVQRGAGARAQCMALRPPLGALQPQEEAEEERPQPVLEGAEDISDLQVRLPAEGASTWKNPEGSAGALHRRAARQRVVRC